MSKIEILYPEHRWVDEATLLTWAADSYFNNADSYRCLTCGKDTMSEDDCLHEGAWAPIYKDGSAAPQGPLEAIEWLSNTGEVTLARRNTVVEENPGYRAGYAYAAGYHD